MSIDLTNGNKTFEVTTVVTRNGERYMGPIVEVTARDESHAKEVAKQHGHESNSYFPPRQTRVRYR